MIEAINGVTVGATNDLQQKSESDEQNSIGIVWADKLQLVGILLKSTIKVVER